MYVFIKIQLLQLRLHKRNWVVKYIAQEEGNKLLQLEHQFSSCCSSYIYHKFICSQEEQK